MATDGGKLAAYGAWAAVCFFWGTTYLGISVGLETFPPLLFAGLRFTTAGVILFLLMSRQRNVRLPVGREWLSLSAVGLALLGVGNGSVVWAQQWLTSGMAALMVASGPFWVATLEGLRSDGERVNRWGVLGMILGFGGLGILVAPKLFGGELGVGYLAGVAVIQMGCFSWSAGSVYTKHKPVGVHPLMGASVQMLVAGAALTLVGTAAGEWGALRVSPRSLGALAYLVVFGSIVAYGSYIYAMQKLPLSIVSTYSYINPVIAVLLGWAVLGEELSWRVALGASVILGGVALVKTAPTLSARRRSRREAAETLAAKAAALDGQEMMHGAAKACSARG